MLVGIIDYGTQTDKFGDRRKVELLFETQEEFHVFNEERGEEPFIIDRKFALTIGKKSALKEALEGMVGDKIEEDEIDLEEFLEKVCMLTITHEKDGDYVNTIITSYSPLGKSDAKRKFKPHNDPIILDLDNFDESVWDSGNFLLPDWKKEIIMKSPEYKEAAGDRVPKGKAKGKQVEEEEEEEEERPARRTAPAKTAVKKAPAKSNELFSRSKKK
jgi:hypothetical protein